MATAGGAVQWEWRAGFPEPYPIAEQVEQAVFREGRLEIQVRVRWRGPAPRLARLVYGGRLAPGCIDLDGLWELRREDAAGAPWLPAPVPGYVPGTGGFVYRRPVRLPRAAGQIALALGGADDDDVCTVGGVEVGSTPLDRASASWEKPRLYPVPPEAAAAGPESLVQVRVTNRDGPGGLWRGPCVLGPRAALAEGGGAGWTLAGGMGRLLHHWCADGAPRPLPGRFTVSLTCQDRTREQVPDNVTTGGRFQLAPYLVAVEGSAGWWGLGTLDLCRAEDGLRVEWRGESFACPFLLAVETPGVEGCWTAGPRVALLVGRSREDILEGYLAAAPLPPRTHWEPWWSGPEYCTWGDSVYEGRLRSVPDTAVLTEASLAVWLAELAARHIEARIVTLDAGWWQLPRDAIARLHREGKRVVLWTQPHWAPLQVPELADHPERLVHDASGRPLLYDASNGLLDLTVPAAREYLARQLRSCVAPEGWDADGVKLDFAYTTAPVWACCGDPAWGAGEQYRARVLRFVYETIKEARPDALVTGSSTNPLFGRVQDVCRLNEDWSGDPGCFRRRAAAVLALGERVQCDDWNAYEHYLPEQAVERAVWGPLVLMSARYRGDRDNAPVPLAPAWASRLSALFALAARAPLGQDDRCLYDPARGLARREAPDGTSLAAGLPVEGAGPGLQALAVRVGDQVLVAGIASGTVVVPLTEAVGAVTEVDDDGASRPARWTVVPGGVRIAVVDAGGPVSHYAVALEPRPGPP